MTDWADALANEITEKYWHHGDGESCQDTPPKVWAAALRKAKADGMMECVKQVEKQQDIYAQKIAILEAEKQDDYIKRKIERTENYAEALRYISEYWEDESSKLTS